MLNLDQLKALGPDVHQNSTCKVQQQESSLLHNSTIVLQR